MCPAQLAFMVSLPLAHTPCPGYARSGVCRDCCCWQEARNQKAWAGFLSQNAAWDPVPWTEQLSTCLSSVCWGVEWSVECPPVCGHSHLRIKNCRQLSPTKEDAFLLGTSRKVVGSQGSFGRKAVWNTRMHPLECFWVLFLSRIPELRAAQRAGLGSFEDSFQRI